MFKLTSPQDDDDDGACAADEAPTPAPDSATGVGESENGESADEAGITIGEGEDAGSEAAAAEEPEAVVADILLEDSESPAQKVCTIACFVCVLYSIPCIEALDGCTAFSSRHACACNAAQSSGSAYPSINILLPICPTLSVNS